MDIFLTKIEIKCFVKANLLNAIDMELIETNYEDLKFNIKTENESFVIEVSGKFEKPVIGKFPLQTETEEEQLRGLMGATMKILNGIARQCKSLIKRV